MNEPDWNVERQTVPYGHHHGLMERIQFLDSENQDLVGLVSEYAQEIHTMRVNLEATVKALDQIIGNFDISHTEAMAELVKIVQRLEAGSFLGARNE